MRPGRRTGTTGGVRGPRGVGGSGACCGSVREAVRVRGGATGGGGGASDTSVFTIDLASFPVPFVFSREPLLPVRGVVRVMGLLTFPFRVSSWSWERSPSVPGVEQNSIGHRQYLRDGTRDRPIPMSVSTRFHRLHQGRPIYPRYRAELYSHHRQDRARLTPQFRSPAR